MKHIRCHWSKDDLLSLNVDQVPDPSVGYHTEDGLNLEKYENIISAGVSRNLPIFFDKDILETEFNWISDKHYAVHKMIPGSILPLHRDKYSYFSSKLNITDFDKIVRVIIFLEDHKIGHILQVENCPVGYWKAGDYVLWQGKKAHLAANFGNEDRYSLQITGILT